MPLIQSVETVLNPISLSGMTQPQQCLFLGSNCTLSWMLDLAEQSGMKANVTWQYTRMFKIWRKPMIGLLFGIMNRKLYSAVKRRFSTHTTAEVPSTHLKNYKMLKLLLCSFFAQKQSMKFAVVSAHSRCSEKERLLIAGSWLPVIQAKLIILTVLLPNTRKVYRVIGML